MRGVIERCLFAAAFGALNGASLLGGCAGSVKTEEARIAGSAGLSSSGGETQSAGHGGTNAEGAAAAAVSGGAAGHGIPSCESARLDSEAQLVECANGMRHRAHASVCGVGTGGASETGDASTGDGAQGLNRACFSDDDCDPGTACLCNASCLLCSGGTSGALCVLATCRTDADCGAGSYCAIGFQSFFTGPQLGFSCLHDDDECTVDPDCTSFRNRLCLQKGDRRVCSTLPE